MKLISLLIAIVICLHVFGQEYIAPITQTLINNTSSSNLTSSSRSVIDNHIQSLALPLVDDFSADSRYPQIGMYNDTLTDTSFVYQFVIDSNSTFDSNRYQNASFGPLSNLCLFDDDLFGTSFEIGFYLELDSITGEDTIQKYPFVFVNGFEIRTISVDSILNEDTVWMTDITPTEGWYDSLILNNIDLINSFRKGDLNYSSGGDYVLNIRIDSFSNFEGDADIEGVSIPNLKVMQIAMTIQVLQTLDTLTYQQIIIDTQLSQHTQFRLWADSNVFVNRSLALYPPSIGVATFDGLDKNGSPYSEILEAWGGSDTLSSNLINLSRYKAADSIILSFFFQPQGLGDQPNDDDRFKLEMLNANGDWIKVWEALGTENKPFEQVLLAIEHPLLLHHQFQFRFISLGNLNGAMDHWHLDYVRLFANGSTTDQYFGDIAISEIPSTLINQYTQIPWSHYNAATSTPDGFLPISIHSIMRDPNVYELNFNIISPDGTDTSRLGTGKTVPNTLHASHTDNETGNVHLDHPDIRAVEYRGFESETVEDSATFKIEYIFMPQADLSGQISYDDNRANDTIVTYQKFHNLYAYDDGSAEHGYGISSPVEGAKMALGFDFYEVDTLRGVYIHWVRRGADLTNESFQITVWNSIGIDDASEEEIIHTSSVSYLNYTDSFDAWSFYALDQPIALEARRYYIGWTQTSLEKLNIGFDVNTDAHENLFFNTNGIWQQSSIEGSLMLRPAIGRNVNPNTIEEKDLDVQLNVYPNPFNHQVNIELDESIKSIQVFDLLGNLLFNGSYNQRQAIIDLSLLNAGLYLMQVQSETAQYRVKLTKP